MSFLHKVEAQDGPEDVKREFGRLNVSLDGVELSSLRAMTNSLNRAFKLAGQGQRYKAEEFLDRFVEYFKSNLERTKKV